MSLNNGNIMNHIPLLSLFIYLIATEAAQAHKNTQKHKFFSRNPPPRKILKKPTFLSLL